MRRSPDFLNKSVSDQFLLILLVTFIVQVLLNLFGDSDILNNLFAFNLNSLNEGYIWSTISYTFLHEGPLHLIFNMLGIHFIARTVESFINKSQFLMLIAFSAISGSIFWLAFNSHSNQYLVGASAIVLGQLSYYCLYQPDVKVSFLLFFLFPVRLKPKWILVGVLGFELHGFLLNELNDIGVVAHSAHLGGMLAGVAIFLDQRYGISVKLRNCFKFSLSSSNQKDKKRVHSNFKVNFSTNCDIKRETDRILDKINENGFGSLTQSEKETLEKAKKLLDS